VPEAWLVISGVSPSLWATRIRTARQTVGRSRDCEVQIAHKTVSRRHAEVWQTDGQPFIRDLNSRNGTFVDGRRIEQSPFGRGSLIQIGKVMLQVVPSVKETYVGSEDDTELLADTPGPWGELVKKLSPGQVQVASLLLRGLTDKQAAERLYLSRHTVHTHVKRIYKLLGVQSRAQLLAKYLGGTKGLPPDRPE
jgi:pSer/pThr/pTyr-binding forkhead associated (FHA) protein